MKKLPKLLSTIAMLAALAISMVVFIIVFTVINPANKSMSELVPAIVMCSIVLVICLGLIAYFVIPKKLKLDDEFANTTETIDARGEYWQDKTVDDIEKYLKHYTEETLCEGQTSKTGGIIFAAKISLFIVILFEIIFVVIAFFWDIGLSDKLKTFLALQTCLIIPAIIFFLMCFQIMGFGRGNSHGITPCFGYRITNKRVYLDFGMGGGVSYNIKNIISLKVKYAFYERNKQYGTIKMKVRNRRLVPLRNHLHSIPEPEKVFAILQNRINNQIYESSLTARVFKNQKCSKCGESLFTVEAKPDEQLYRIICKHCKEIQYIEDSADLWDETEEEISKYKCMGKEGHESFYITLGYAMREDGSKKWLYIGYLCDECKVLGCIDDIKLS